MIRTSMSRRRFLDLGRDSAVLTLAAAAAPAAVLAQGGTVRTRLVPLDEPANISTMPIAGDPVHGLQVDVGSGLRSETWLNGILLERTEAGEASGRSIPIQHDMVPGRNLAEVRVGLAGMDLERPPAPISGALPANATARLRLQMDQAHRDGDALQTVTRDVDQLAWPPADDGGRASVALPHRLALAFTPLSPIVAPPWANATRDLPKGTAEAVYARMAELAGMLRDGNEDAYQNACAVRGTHMARSYPLGLTAEAARAHDIEQFKMLRAELGFTVTLLPRSKARFRTMAGGRLLDWTDAAGEPILTLSTRDEPPSPVNMQFSLIGGKLVMTR